MSGLYAFTVKGKLDASGLEPLTVMGKIVGFKLPDGREAKLVIGLEVESAGSYAYTANSSEIEALGLTILDYDQADLEPDGQEAWWQEFLLEHERLTGLDRNDFDREDVITAYWSKGTSPEDAVREDMEKYGLDELD